MADNTKVVNNTSEIDNAKLMGNNKQVERAGLAGRDQGFGPKKQKILKLLIGNEPLSHFPLPYPFHEFEILCVLCFHFSQHLKFDWMGEVPILKEKQNQVEPVKWENIWHKTGPHNLRSFLTAKSTQNYFRIARMIIFCDLHDKSAVMAILRQNETIFYTWNG